VKDYHPILKYWFNELKDSQNIDKESKTVKRWFSKDERVDKEIQKKFENDLIKAKDGEYLAWEESSAGRLALVILLDQFSRNIYRGTSRMFENDPLAIELTLRSINDQMDTELQLIERKFLYMPLMHAEDLHMQEMSLRYYTELFEQVKEVNANNKSYYADTLDYAKKHYDIIQRFDRFPHRNAILNRETTKEEEEFLKESNSSF